MTVTDESPSRPGSGADLSRRMDRLEQNHEALAATVSSLAGTVSRVELNQTHQAELTKLRFDSLDTGLGTVKDTLERFMGRINAIISGEVQLPQNTALMADWKAWRIEVDEDREDQGVRNGRLDLVGKIALVLFTGNIGAIAAGVVVLLNHKP